MRWYCCDIFPMEFVKYAQEDLIFFFTSNTNLIFLACPSL
jgi:hypothetical protein